MQDLFEHVRPKMKRHTNFEEAFEAVVAIEAEDAAAAAAGVQSDDSDSDDGGSRPGLGSDDEGDDPLLLKLLVLRMQDGGTLILAVGMAFMTPSYHIYAPECSAHGFQGPELGLAMVCFVT